MLFTSKKALKPLIVFTLLACGHTTYAAPVTIGFTGHVSSIFKYSTASVLPSMPGIPSIAVNSAFHGRIIYDSAAPIISIYGGATPYDSTFYIFQTPLQFEMTFDDGTDNPVAISYTGNMNIRLEDNPQPGPPPKHLVEFQHSGSALTGLQDWSVAFNDVMIIHSQDGFNFSPSAPALPQYVDEIMQPFYGSALGLRFVRGNQTYIVDSYFETIQTLPSVPVPPAIVLFGSALLGVVGIARKQDRRASH